MTDLVNASYILDGVPMPLSPAKMLRECTVEPPLEPDGDPATIADEHLDQVPGNFAFEESEIDSYALTVEHARATVPLEFAGAYTAGKVAQGLLDAIWLSGHFRMEDLMLKADWKWKDSPIGLPAAFYDSVEAACSFIDALGVKISKYGLISGAPSVSFKASVTAEDEQEALEEESLLMDLRTSSPKMSRRRKCQSKFLPEESDWIIYIPFDTCDFRMGGSRLAQAVGATPSSAPEIGDADYFMDCYEVVRELVEDGVVKAGATVSGGGLITALRAMCGATSGANICISDIRRAYNGELPIRVLFAEVPGVIIQIADIDYDYVDAELLLQDVVFFPLGHPDISTSGIVFSEKTDLPHILESLMSSMEGED